MHYHSPPHWSPPSENMAINRISGGNRKWKYSPSYFWKFSPKNRHKTNTIWFQSFVNAILSSHLMVNCVLFLYLAVLLLYHSLVPFLFNLCLMNSVQGPQRSHNYSSRRTINVDLLIFRCLLRDGGCV